MSIRLVQSLIQNDKRKLPWSFEALSKWFCGHCACHPWEYIEYLILQIFCIWRMNWKRKTFHAILFSEKDIFQTVEKIIFIPKFSKLKFLSSSQSWKLNKLVIKLLIKVRKRWGNVSRILIITLERF